MGCASCVQKNAAESFDACYDLVEKIGDGTFAQVHSCVHKKTLKTFAVKISKTPSSKERLIASRELEVWTQVGSHANVVTLLESYVEPAIDFSSKATYFVMQRCRCSVMDMRKLNKHHFPNNDILDIFHQAFLGLQHCHAVNIVHRDVKASNLLLDFDGVVKLTDFGLSLIVPKVADGVSGIVGSTPYMSPEMVKGTPYGFGTDIWSCAAVMYWLLYGEYPYDAARGMKGDERKKCMMKAIKADKPRPKYESVNGAKQPAPQIQELIQTLLQRNVDKRPDAHRSVELVLITKNDLESTGCTTLPKAHGELEAATESTTAHGELDAATESTTDDLETV